MNVQVVLLILFLLMVMQVLGTSLQVKEYRKTVHKLHELGILGIGSFRRRFGPGNIVIIACDSEGMITGGRIMQGMTIFTRFRDLEGIVGKSIYQLKSEYLILQQKNKNYYKGHLQALEALEKRLGATAEKKGAEEGLAAV